MEVKIQQWGNSAAIRLPATVLKQLSLASGDVLLLDTTAQGLTLKPAKAKRHYSLDELLAQCDFSLPRSQEEIDWEAAPPVGRELW